MCHVNRLTPSECLLKEKELAGILRFILVTIMLSPLFCVSILKLPKVYEPLLTKIEYQIVNTLIKNGDQTF